MEILFFFLIGILLLFGIAGSFLPIVPGPLLSYIGLLLSHFLISRISIDSLVLMGLGFVIITILDYFLQLYGVKKAGGGKYAIRGSLAGMLLGIFLFPPFGILFGALIGAYIGAKIEMDENAVGVAFGALWGFLLGTVLKLCFSIYIIYFLIFQ